MLVSKVLKFYHFIEIIWCPFLINVLLDELIETAFENLKGFIGVNKRFSSLIDCHEGVFVDGASEVGIIDKKWRLLDYSFIFKLLNTFNILNYGESTFFRKISALLFVLAAASKAYSSKLASLLGTTGWDYIWAFQNSSLFFCSCASRSLSSSELALSKMSSGSSCWCSSSISLCELRISPSYSSSLFSFKSFLGKNDINKWKGWIVNLILCGIQISNKMQKYCCKNKKNQSIFSKDFIFISILTLSSRLAVKSKFNSSNNPHSIF